MRAWATTAVLAIACLMPPVHAQKSTVGPADTAVKSLRNTPCNVRVGPGKDYPIQWVMQQPHAPVLVIATHHDWYKIKDIEASTGWVHKSMVSQRAYAQFTPTLSIVRRAASSNAAPVAKVHKGMICRRLACKAGWCHIAIDTPNKTLKGYVESQHLWPHSPA